MVFWTLNISSSPHPTAALSCVCLYYYYYFWFWFSNGSKGPVCACVFILVFRENTFYFHADIFLLFFVCQSVCVQLVLWTCIFFYGFFLYGYKYIWGVFLLFILSIINFHSSSSFFFFSSTIPYRLTEHVFSDHNCAWTLVYFGLL